MGCLFPLLAAVLLAPPFWEVKTPRQWTDEELRWMFAESPWVQPAIATRGIEGIPVYLATAKPMREAEAERRRRDPFQARAPLDGEPEEQADTQYEEYIGLLHENEGKIIALAVPMPAATISEEEIRQIEQRSSLRAGGKRYRILGHFAPSRRDPYLRLIFPRVSGAGEKSLRFDLYLPFVDWPLRQLSFPLKDLVYHGQPEF